MEIGFLAASGEFFTFGGVGRKMTKFAFRTLSGLTGQDHHQRELHAKWELHAHILGFWCTIEYYSHTKHHGKTPTYVRERASLGFDRKCMITLNHDINEDSWMQM